MPVVFQVLCNQLRSVTTWIPGLVMHFVLAVQELEDEEGWRKSKLSYFEFTRRIEVRIPDTCVLPPLAPRLLRADK